MGPYLKLFFWAHLVPSQSFLHGSPEMAPKGIGGSGFGKHHFKVLFVQLWEGVS